MPQRHTPRSPLGRVLFKALDEAGFSETKAAKDTGIPPTTLHRHLHNGDFRVSEVKAIARLIGTRASVLMARAEDDEVAA